jgi:hypothetical protein
MSRAATHGSPARFDASVLPGAKPARFDQLRFIHYACRRLGLDPLMMAPPGAFGLADEEAELAVDLPAEVALAPDDAAVAQAEQGDAAADLGADDLQDAGDDVYEAADQEPGGATKCAYCNFDVESGDERHVINGQLYHGGFCIASCKQNATAAG